MLRDLALTKLGRNGDEATVAEARKRFDAHVAGTSALPADLKSPVSFNKKYLIGTSAWLSNLNGCRGKCDYTAVSEAGKKFDASVTCKMVVHPPT